MSIERITRYESGSTNNVDMRKAVEELNKKSKRDIERRTKEAKEEVDRFSKNHRRAATFIGGSIIAAEAYTGKKVLSAAKDVKIVKDVLNNNKVKRTKEALKKVRNSKGAAPTVIVGGIATATTDIVHGTTTEAINRYYSRAKTNADRYIERATREVLERSKPKEKGFVDKYEDVHNKYKPDVSKGVKKAVNGIKNFLFN
ncbi:hypothetical protein [Dethiothermospora halolimnae]|uniref:hypothetical protein n=1 Tax=Dethiothermospora halolimnae TaxID=3114390 RepID=UPI003CCB9DCE